MTARQKYLAAQAALLAARNGRSAADSPPAPNLRRKRRKEASDISPVLLAMTEAQFQRQVREHLRAHGWTVWVFPIMKRTMAGVPDLTFWHPDKPGRIYAWELKRETRYVVSEAQSRAIAHLSTVPGIDARIVRPSEWPRLRDELEER